MKHSILFTIVLVLANTSGSGAYASNPIETAGITEFHQVNADLYRGSRPSAAGLKALQKAGFTTILNLENLPAAIANEEKDAAALGLKEISFPMEFRKAPTDSEIDAILSSISNPSNGKVFIHCRHGQDRTGLVLGLYRIRHDHWTPAKAYKEMLADNFHPFLKALDGYFKTHSSD